jgi:hypothetical protein
MYLQKVISRQVTKLRKKLVFFGVSKVNDENRRFRIQIRILKLDAWIRGSGSTSKCHGSATLLQKFNDDPCIFPPEVNFCMANLDVSGELVPVGQPLTTLRTRVRPEVVNS